jgi:mitochondrial fission protein ELM1
MKRVVWIIGEGSPGHVSQSEGLAAVLAAYIDLEKHVIETRPQFGGFMRTWVRWWMGSKGRGLSDRFLRKWLSCDFPITRPDLIITSGGKAVFAARSLAVKTGAPLVFIGERKPYPSEWFHTVLTPSPFETGVNDIQLDLIPTRITRESVEKAAASWPERPEGRLWAMVVGGASASHRYTDKDWSALATGMSTLARREGIRWLITTSRRTGADAERLLREMLDPATVADAIWWSNRPEKRMHAFLGSAERNFITQDSMTMVSEAIASGKPVEVVYPRITTFTATSFIPFYLERLANSGRIRLHAMDSLDQVDFKPWSQDSTLPEVDFASKLLVRLIGL